jgi:hypothetical protein
MRSTNRAAPVRARPTANGATLRTGHDDADGYPLKRTFEAPRRGDLLEVFTTRIMYPTT